MPRYPQPRQGTELKIRDRLLEFSYWPMRKGKKRHGLQSRLFASDPWNVLEAAVREKTAKRYTNRALAALEQANDFHHASTTGAIRAARPLLLYYCFMNIVKAFAIMKGQETDFDDSRHGLSPIFPQRHGSPLSAKIKCFQNRPPGNLDTVNVYDLLHQQFTNQSLIANYQGQNNWREMRLQELMPQILLGHRLWAASAARKERFVEIDKIRFLDDRGASNCWIVLKIVTDEFTRHGYTHNQVFDGARLQALWRRTEPLAGEPATDRPRLRIELTAPENYGDRPSDVINQMVDKVRNCLWRSITTSKPFRKYYVYIADQNDWVVPQVCSIYMLMFYLGSITRYRPEQFDVITRGKFGAFIQEFIENQPNQWLYMMASELTEQEVTHAAIV